MQKKSVGKSTSSTESRAVSAYGALRYLNEIQIDMARQRKTVARDRLVKRTALQRQKRSDSAVNRQSVSRAERMLEKSVAILAAQQTALQAAKNDLRTARSKDRIEALEEACNEKINDARERMEAQAQDAADAAMAKLRAGWLRKRRENDELALKKIERRARKRLQTAREEEARAMQRRLSGRRQSAGKPGPKSGSKPAPTNGRRKPGPQPGAASGATPPSAPSYSPPTPPSAPSYSPPTPPSAPSYNPSGPTSDTPDTPVR